MSTKAINSTHPYPWIEGANGRSTKRRRYADEVARLKLGRFPFAAAIETHMKKRYGILSETTYKEEERKLRMLAKVFEDLKREGRIDTTDPRHMRRKEIQEFLAWMKRQGLDPTAQDKYLKFLKVFLRSFRNRVIEDMKADGIKFPKPTKKPIRVIDEGDLDTIFQSIGNMPAWRGSVARGMLAIYFATGVRPKELRLALLDDLDLGKMKFLVRHPKGEGSWASQEKVDLIRPDVVPYIERYLRERKEWIRTNGLKESEVKQLFPSIRFGKNKGFYTANGFQQIKSQVQRISGVEFKLKDFRSTLTSMTVNGDMGRLNAMSAQLRHDKIETTQRAYYRMLEGVAGRQLKDAWKERPIAIVHETPLIEKRFETSGYA